MSKNRCQACNGEKKVMGMGGMKEKCSPCSGTGFIEEKEEIKPKKKG
jgi:DnaJ-class molecular chaperone